MNKTIVNPGKGNHNVYIRLVILFVSFRIPKETNDL